MTERLGIQTFSLKSNDISAKISSFASQNSYTKIVIGKPYSSVNFRSVDSILANTEGIDMYIFAGRGNIAQKNMTPSLKDPVKEMLKRIRLINKKITYSYWTK